MGIGFSVVSNMADFDTVYRQYRAGFVSDEEWRTICLEYLDILMAQERFVIAKLKEI